GASVGPSTIRSGLPWRSGAWAASSGGAVGWPRSGGAHVAPASTAAAAVREANRMARLLRGGGAKLEQARRPVKRAYSITGLQEHADRSVQAPARELLHQVADHRLGVAEQHPGVVLDVQLVVDPRKAGVLAALDGQHRLRLVRVDDRHAVDGRVLGVARGGVDDVVRPD